MFTILQLFIPFIGTTLGSALVFFFKDDSLNPKVEKLLLGFAAGVMIAAAFFSLLLPSLEYGEGTFSFMPAVVGYLLGIGFMLASDTLIPHLHRHENEPEGLTPKKAMSRTILIFLAITLHNVPEGATAGIALVSSNASAIISQSAAMALLLGIAIQNFPEGAIISLPLRASGYSKWKAFLYGSMSGIIEPITSLLMFIIAPIIEPIMPYALSFAAGVMMYVVIEELIPDANSGEHSNVVAVAFSIGFVIMLILDVVLG